MDAETLAFINVFDVVYTLRGDMERILGIVLVVHTYTDSRLLFDALTRGRRTSERRLTVDITAARETYRNQEIACIGLINGHDNPADALSKVIGNTRLRRMQSGTDNTPVME